MATPTSPVTTNESVIRCPYCAEVIAAAAKKCKHCGEYLDQSLRQSAVPAPAAQQAWIPGVAAVLSLVIPGAGQIYKGQLNAGIAWLVGVVVGYCLFIVPGLLAHIVCIYKAYSEIPVKAKSTVGSA